MAKPFASEDKKDKKNIHLKQKKDKKDIHLKQIPHVDIHPASPMLERQKEAQ